MLKSALFSMEINADWTFGLGRKHLKEVGRVGMGCQSIHIIGYARSILVVCNHCLIGVSCGVDGMSTIYKSQATVGLGVSWDLRHSLSVIFSKLFEICGEGAPDTS